MIMITGRLRDVTVDPKPRDAVEEMSIDGKWWRPGPIRSST